MTGFNLNRRPIGRCSQCGGVVSTPTVWHGVNRPVPSCESCGADMDEAGGLPTVPTIPVRRGRRDHRGEPRPRYGPLRAASPDQILRAKCHETVGAWLHNCLSAADH